MFTSLLAMGTALQAITAVTVGEAMIAVGTVCAAVQTIKDAVEDL